MEAFATGRLKVHKTEHTAAERLFAHIVGNSAAKSNDRSDRLELRRPIMVKWAEYATGGKPVLAPQPSKVAFRARS
jgi:hypothetical protein